MKLLFIDATIREPEESRTYQICQAYLDEMSRAVPALEIKKIVLRKEALRPYLAADIEKRDGLAVDSDDSMLDYAKEFAQADAILIGAPYWDGSFPAILKLYLEQACVNGITFEYAADGQRKKCRAKKMTYITSIGGFLAGCDFGTEYLKGLCDVLFLIPEFEAVSAEGLDIEGADVVQIMEGAYERARLAAEM